MAETIYTSRRATCLELLAPGARGAADVRVSDRVDPDGLPNGQAVTVVGLRAVA